MKEFTITKNDANQRLDKFITKACPTLPSALMFKYIRLLEMRPNRVEIAVKMMPTCIPLTARICEAPALEKSFFIFLFSSDLLARHSARHKDDDVLSSFSEIISLVFSLMFLAFSSSMLS